MDNVRALEKELARLKSKLAATQGDDLADQAVAVGSARVLAAKLDGADAKSLRETMDKLKDKLRVGRHRAGVERRQQGHADRGRDRRPHRASSRPAIW